MARLAGPLVGATLLVAASDAGATPSARLVYLRNPGAESCPDETVVRAAVAARLGYDPFLLHAPATMFVELSKDGRAFHARVKLVDDQNLVRGTRELASATGRCEELVDAMALSMSIAIDPDSLTRGPAPPVEPAPATPTPAEPPPPPAPPASQAQPPLAQPAPPSSRAAGERLHLDASLGPALWIGAAPAVSVSGLASVAARYRFVSLGLEGRYDLPASGRVSGQPIRTSLVFAGLAPCIHWSFLAGCAVWNVGSITAEAPDVTLRRSDSALHSALGPSVRASWRVAGPLSLWARADALFTLTPQRFSLGATDLGALSRASVGLALGASVRFF